jgi:hypothetical protein
VYRAETNCLDHFQMSSRETFSTLDLTNYSMDFPGKYCIIK